ncbi:hypothetical protein BCS95_15020 [Vibrio breoganii]|uniref:asparagine synthase-related protein n=1 Tax=Vibrio breoganii TaxID=553239 RepID=UPI000CB99818|nr:asparagine synthase-related protein [Vibrio breoganii]PMP01125.1 hypothetical protein BCS95_15020 [Vibrio breoganii]
MFEYYDSLGSRSYYQLGDDQAIYSSIRECLNANPTFSAEIDSVAILGILMKNYAIGNRSLVKGVERTPWMSSKIDNVQWDSAELPCHGNENVTPVEASKNLYESLCQEVLDFTSDKKTIGILLSGGMDSRIVAGIVRRLQESGEYSGDVIALTWGIPESRDVVYAKRIADEFAWGFEHFELTASVLADNIELSALRGAEYSPVHLHAMKAISELRGIDGILAGSYGDSIGRGEYSGRRTNELPRILDKHQHHFSFMLKNVERKCLLSIKKDLAEARARFPGRSEMAYREIEMQMHYMRRQLNSCMEVIDDKISLYQMFGSPRTFGYMWSLDSNCRSDDVYEYLIKGLPKILQDIPWARTGKKYNDKNASVEDCNSSLNNRYGLWLRTDLREQIVNLINNGSLQSLGVFNEQSLKMWIKYWSSGSAAKADRLDEKMAWLASLSLFVERYDVKPPSKEMGKRSLLDSYSQARAYIHTMLYHAAIKYRK